MKKITVLMTVYNGGEFLKQSIPSVLHQTYKDFEFLIVNDCSTDDSLKVIQAFHDPRIVIYNNPHNIGQTKSLNLGFQLAKGDYVARIDADDIAFPHWLQSQVDFLDKHEPIDILSAGLVTFNNNKIQKVYFSPSSREDMMFRAIINSPINHGSALMNKEVVLKAGGYNSQYGVPADYDLWVRLLSCQARITSNPEILMAIRRHPQSYSQEQGVQQSKNMLELSQIIRQHVGNISSAEFIEKESRILYRAHYEEGRQDFDEFNQAIDIHKRIYDHLRPEANLSREKARHWYKKQAQTLFLRRVYAFIPAKDLIEIRRTCRQALKILGFNGYFFLMFIFSFFSSTMFDFIYKAYHTGFSFIARLCLRQKEKYVLSVLK